MMRYKVLFTLIFSALSLQSFSQGRQGSLSLMTYNILNYRNGTTYCTGSNNSSSAKEQAIHTVVDFAQPDVIVFNEVGSAPASPVYLLNNALNTGGTTHFEMVPHAHNGFSSLVNAIAYNKDRLSLSGQWAITKDANNTSLVRLIDVAKFDLIDTLATSAWDTISFYVFAAHFKAGSGTSDAAERDLAANAIIDWIDNNLSNVTDPNILLLGDLNTYSSTENCYQTLTTGSTFRFEDPINTTGSWHNSSSYASIHTQSTSTASSGCKSGGGLDDRFDHILISEALSEGDNHLTYANNSYLTIGNDGNHFNNAINSGTNYSASSTVIEALATASDHLPVLLNLDFQFYFDQQELSAPYLTLPNPLSVGTPVELPQGTTATLFTLTGQRLAAYNQAFTTPQLTPGIYLFQFEDGTSSWVQKISIR